MPAKRTTAPPPCSECAQPGYCKGLCRRCYNAQYRQEHKEQLLAYEHGRAASRLQSKREYNRAYFQAHKAQFRIAGRRWYYENHERARAQKRAASARWRSANPEREREYKRRRRASPLVREQERLAAAKRRRANPELYRATNRAWARAHPESQRAWLDAHRARVAQWTRLRRVARGEEYRKVRHSWTTRNVHRIREYAGRGRARRRKAFLEGIDPAVLYERDKGICQICGLPVALSEMSIDHVVPLSRGGKHSYANTQTAHRRCNLRRGATGPGQSRLF